MADYDIARNVTLELRLQVAKAKLTKLRLESEQLVDEVLGVHSNRDPKAQAKRLRIILQELENETPNLHR